MQQEGIIDKSEGKEEKVNLNVLKGKVEPDFPQFPVPLFLRYWWKHSAKYYDRPPNSDSCKQMENQGGIKEKKKKEKKRLEKRHITRSEFQMGKDEKRQMAFWLSFSTIHAFSYGRTRRWLLLDAPSQGRQ